MRRLVTLAALCALATSAAAGQRHWQSEIGIQGGWSRLKQTGTGQSDALDVYDIPGAGVLDALPTYGTVFFVLAWKDRVAVEPSLRIAQTTPTTITTGTIVTFGLRGNYAITPKAYASVGGLLAYTEANGINERQVGLQAALGYRLGLTSRINGRIEAQVVTMHKSDNASPFNVYSAVFGVSTRLAGPGGRPAVARTRSGRRAWEPALGIAAGYSRMHIAGGGGDLAVFSFPGSGAAGVAGIFAASSPTLFALWPMGPKLAFEAGLDVHQYNIDGEATLTAQVAPRLNYAIKQGWYAGAGPSVRLLKNVTGPSALIGVAGAHAAFGYRFRLTGELGGRVELRYAAYKERSDFGGAANVLGATAGITTPMR